MEIVEVLAGQATGALRNAQKIVKGSAVHFGAGTRAGQEAEVHGMQKKESGRILDAGRDGFWFLAAFPLPFSS